MPDVVVLGAGVIGMTSAYALARAGYSVTVVDEGAGPAEGGASFGNGSQLSYAYTDALASPGLLRNLPVYLLGMDDAFRLQPTWLPGFWLWAIRFLANTRRSAFEENTIEVLKLALESRRAVGEARDDMRFDFQHRIAGKLHILASADAISQATAMSEIKRRHGVRQEILTAQEALDREPALQEYRGQISGALWSPDDEVGDCLNFCRGLRALLEREYGVVFKFNTKTIALKTHRREMAAVVTDSGEMRCTRAVVALGVHSAAIARTAKVNVPVWPMQGYSLTVPATDLAPEVSVTDTLNKVVICKLGDRLRIAGLAGIGVRDPKFSDDRFKSLVGTARRLFPKAGDFSGDLNAWSGLRPLSPNSQPIIGATSIKGLYLNCGHGSLGWTLSMGSANRLVSSMSTET